jgi:hypothetical protein
MCETPAYGIILLNVANSACETSQNAQKTSSLQAFSRSRLSRLPELNQPYAQSLSDFSVAVNRDRHEECRIQEDFDKRDNL